MALKMMGIYDVVVKLTGPIVPVGETTEDEKRFQNLQEVTHLVDRLLSDVQDVSADAERHEYSMKRAGAYAEGYLKAIIDAYGPA